MGTPVTFSLDEIQPAPPPAQQKKPVTFNLSEIRKPDEVPKFKGGDIQTKPGGPIYNMQTNPPPPPPKEGFFSRLGRGFTETAGLPSTLADVPGTVRQLTSSPSVEGVPGVPAWDAQSGLVNAAINTVRGIGQSAQATWDRPGPQNKILGSLPIVGPMIRGLTDKLEAHDYAGLLGGLGAVATMGTKPEDAAAAVNKTTAYVKGIPSRTVQGMANLGEARARTQAALDANAQVANQHITKAATAFKQDASTAMGNVLQAVDQQFPDGVIDAAKRRAQIQQDLGDIIKTDPGRLPKSLQEMLATEPTSVEKPMPQATAYEALAASQLAKKFTDSGMKMADVRPTLAAQGYSARAVDSAMASLSSTGEMAPDMWTATQAKEFRTKLRQDMNRGGIDGPIYAVMGKLYRDLTQDLNGAATKAGVLPDWQRANAKWSFWAQNIDDPSSPVGKILNGENADQIMRPLTGPDAVIARRTLGTLANYGLDPEAVAQAAKLHEVMERGESWATPHRWQIMFAPMTAGASLLPTIPGRIMQRPGIAKFLSGPSAADVNMFRGGKLFSPEEPIAPPTPAPQLALPSAGGSTVLPSSGQTIQLGQSAEGMQALAKQAETKLTRDLSTGRISQADVMAAAKRGEIDAKAPSRIFRAAKRGVPEPPPSTAEDYLGRR